MSRSVRAPAILIATLASGLWPLASLRAQSLGGGGLAYAVQRRVSFLGTVRDHSREGNVTGLTYEAWDELATERLTEIADELFEGWTLRKVAILHRTGDLGVGETSVVVAASAPHRPEAFDACRQGIERLKQDVPIWKKEALVTGDAHWVMGS